ncbi:hypothetical protein GCM10011492_00720 [Flexivirga endophytica]|uniref:Lipoprotein with Yx(FWY)xxD motif n=2 Tax=Flexivirga endophytica TaxID=1849103 RepID=A0A916SUV3_9MICO|nr:hypothetical protein GCM10011492_00720 [Flexivirga endophytica]GHB65347.1 hypothetical protein GCM10008112_37770 [Flexivirga endophytica]
MGAAGLMATLAACGSSGSSGVSAPAASSGMATSAGSKAPATSATLKVAKTSLGEVVVGPNGRTAYMFGKDVKNSGKSSCTGPCLSYWPPVTTTGALKAIGVSGKVGTITTADGKKQVTLGGWPLYYYAGDGAAGDVKGQGNERFGGVWRALTAGGAEVTATAPPSSTGGGGKGGYSY